MVTLLMVGCLSFCKPVAQDTLVDPSILTFISPSIAVDTKFNIIDLARLASLTGAETLGLRVATCPLPHVDSRYDELSGTAGYQHVVAIAKNSAGEMINISVALPCPPHCGGKYVDTFRYFMENYY